MFLRSWQDCDSLASKLKGQQVVIREWNSTYLCTVYEAEVSAITMGILLC